MNLSNLEQREAVSRTLYTGFAPIQIIAVNPNVDKLKSILNSEDVKEPQYVGEENTRLDFWYVNHPQFNTELKGKFSIWVSNKLRESATGKKQYIDSFARTVWSEDVTLIDSKTSHWADSVRPDKKTIREAKEGEEMIYNLLKSYGNLNPQKQMLVLDSWDALVKGNGSELEEFFKFFNKDMAGVRVLLGVKDGKYQDVYTRRILGLYNKITERINQEISGEYGYKSFYNDSFEFQKFDPSSIPSDEVEVTESDMFATEGSSSSSPTTTNTADDDPFSGF